MKEFYAAHQITPIDFKNYGKYIALNLYKFRPEQKMALFELVYILNLIHNDMLMFKPELAKYLAPKGSSSLEGTRYYAIFINMVELFKQNWFKDYRSDKKYDLEWMKVFMTDLLNSEFRDEIADDWYKPNKALSVKGYIIGCLIEAGILVGSKLAIASAVVNGEIKGNSFAIYFTRGKKMDYCDWICDYVRR